MHTKTIVENVCSAFCLAHTPIVVHRNRLIMFLFNYFSIFCFKSSCCCCLSLLINKINSLTKNLISILITHCWDDNCDQRLNISIQQMLNNKISNVWGNWSFRSLIQAESGFYFNWILAYHSTFLIYSAYIFKNLIKLSQNMRNI